MKSFFKFCLFVFIFAPLIVSANIDLSQKWAWGRNIGWINFHPTAGGVTVTGTGLTGSAWSSNYGWIYMRPSNGGVSLTNSIVLGKCTSRLSGSAWSPQLGWIDFSGVFIDEAGKFYGGALGQNSGNIIFSGTNFGVKTSLVPICASQLDTDGDGVPDAQEIIDGTNPNNSTSFLDTDGDSIPNYLDPNPSTPGDTLPDTDGDGIPNIVETIQGTNPADAQSFQDSDNDGVPDYIEAQEGTNSSNPNNKRDTDKDGVPDYVELHAAPPSNPNDPTSFPDTDGDGIPNYLDSRPTVAGDVLPDTDGDGVPDIIEIIQGTNPTLPSSNLDTDGDGVSDYVENTGFNKGDGDGNGIRDSLEQNVSAAKNPVTGQTSTLKVTGGCTFITENAFVAEGSLGATDPTADYPVGLVDFKVLCSSTGASSVVTIYYARQYDTSTWRYKKYDRNGNAYADITPKVTFGTGIVGSGQVTTVSFTVTDGDRDTDEDRLANGVINDPSGPAILVSIPLSGAGGGGPGGVQTGVTRLPDRIVPIPNLESILPEYATTRGKNGLLPSQTSLKLSGLTKGSFPVYSLTGMLTEALCQDIVGVYREDEVRALDIEDSPFVYDIKGLIMFRGLEKDEILSGASFAGNEGIARNSDSYQPDRYVTRAEYTKMLIRSLSCRYENLGSKTPFSDVSSVNWYAPYISFAYKNSWITGYNDGTFRPDSPISRAEAAKILANAIKLTKNTEASSFLDVPSEDRLAPYIEALKKKKVILGTSPNTFEPEKYITRGEVARIIYKTFLGGKKD